VIFLPLEARDLAALFIDIGDIAELFFLPTALNRYFYPYGTAEFVLFH